MGLKGGVVMEVSRFKINREVGYREIETRIAEAIQSAEKNFGKAKVRLYTEYFLSGNWVVIDISSRVGEHVATKFTESLIEDFGEESFTVERIRNESNQKIKESL